ncbi:MAG: hypothetical protein F4151_03745 [Gammaproteobacteria bacterium]|nr:hypothetical protein [Gammaproteobacteria bacterium]
MTILRPVRPDHTGLPITRCSKRSGAVARILQMLTASFALAVGADSAQAAGPDIQAASDTLTITLAAPEGGTVAEGTTGHFVVSVAGSTVAGAVNVRYSIAGTAVAGEDYTALSGEVTVAQGENVARIALEAIQDSILDKGETVVLALTGVTASAAAWVFEHAAKTATIADNGSVTVALTAVPDTISEGAAWRSTVTMSTAVADRVSVRWWTNDGTAVAGQDYTAADAEVVFQPGETSKPIQVQTLEDDNAEAVEFFYVSLNPPSISTSAATLGAMTVNGDALSAFIECSIRFPQRGPIVFRLNDPVAAGTVVDTVAAEASGIADYFLTGGDNKFTINARGEIRTTAALVAGRRYELAVTAVDHCDAKASVDVTVIVNSSPRKVGTIPDAAVEEEESGLVDVSDYFSDPDGNRLTYTATSSDTTVLKVRVSGSDVTFTGVSAGNASVTVTATDPGGLLAQQTFTVTVEEPNDPPVVERPLADLTLYVGEPPNDAEIDISGVFKDPDGDALGYTANSSDTDVATATLTGSTLTVTATGKGNATVTVTATDPGGLAAQDTFEVSVPNRAPTCTAIPSQEVDAGQIVRVDLANLCSDDDGDELTFGGENSDDTDVATVSLKGSVLTITGVSSGSANVKATADDDNGGSVNTSGPVTVTQPNRAPVVEDEIEDLTLHVGDPPNEEEIDLSDVFSDPDGDVLGYTAVSSNTAVATATVDGHTLTVTATGKGRTTVTVTATDPGDLSAVDEFDVEVPNREPTVAEAIADLTLYVGDPPNKTAINISGVFEDADGDVLRYTVNVANTNVATATLSGNTLTVTAAGKGRTRVTLTADDRMGGTKADVFQVDVPNRGPTAEGTISDRTVYVGESRSLDVARYFDDPDGDDLTYTPVSSDTDKLTVSGTGSRVRFRGVAVGSATVTVTATDTGNLTATQQFDVEVYAEQPTCTIRVSNADLPVREDAGAGAALTPDVSVDATDCGTLRYALTGTGSGDFSVAAAGANDDDARSGAPGRSTTRAGTRTV